MWVTREVKGKKIHSYTQNQISMASKAKQNMQKKRCKASFAAK